jgi:hypothetical protein
VLSFYIRAVIAAYVGIAWRPLVAAKPVAVDVVQTAHEATTAKSNKG